MHELVFSIMMNVIQQVKEFSNHVDKNYQYQINVFLFTAMYPKTSQNVGALINNFGYVDPIFSIEHIMRSKWFREHKSANMSHINSYYDNG